MAGTLEAQEACRRLVFQTRDRLSKGGSPGQAEGARAEGRALLGQLLCEPILVGLSLSQRLERVPAGTQQAQVLLAVSPQQPLRTNHRTSHHRVGSCASDQPWGLSFPQSILVKPPTAPSPKTHCSPS